MFPMLLFIMCHIPSLSVLGVRDLADYIEHKRYNECKEFGKIKMFTASSSQVFGSGKTLTIVRQARKLYKRYNDVDVWDSEHMCFVKQHIYIVSNVTLNDIPYVKWTGADQLKYANNLEFDGKKLTSHDVVIFLLDEAGIIFNSRNYRDNLDSEMLKTLLQSRHIKIALYMTTQRFLFADKILRETSSVVTTCRKIWRIVRLQDYDAYDLENCSNPALIKPLSTYFYIAFNDDYLAYDTTELIENLRKSNPDEFLSSQEILDLRGVTVSGDSLDMVSNKKIKRRYRKRVN